MMNSEGVLVGDVGGTNVRFGVALADDTGKYTVTSFVKWAGEDFPSLQEAIRTFIQGLERPPKHMSLAVAGPIKNGVAELTNRAWSVGEKDCVDRFDMSGVMLFNDFTAMSRCVPELPDDDFDHVHTGAALPSEPILVAGPGTGFGVGYLVPVKKGWRVLSTEGGFTAFAPRTQAEMDVTLILQKSYDFVSTELICSGKGLNPVHRAVCERRGIPYAQLPPAEISRLGALGDAVCQEVCMMRASATMGAIGDLALSGGARGGIVLAGGVSERMIDWFRKPVAMQRYFNRGHHEDYVRNIPIRLLTNPMAPLIGAAALYWDHKADH